MEEAGMHVEAHPLGLIGTYKGTNTDLAPVGLMSHFDSVPEGGMYDGAIGIVSAIKVVKALHQQKIKLPRGIKVIALTGEESSRFNLALFGSRGMFQGLTEQELASQKPGDINIAQALEQAGLNPNDVEQPLFVAEDLHAVVELHVSQDNRLSENELDLAVVEAIAAPDRHKLEIGDPIQPDTNAYAHTQYLQVEVTGQTGHSGATPMGKENRADALVAISNILMPARHFQENLLDKNSTAKITIGGIAITSEALNKIPGDANAIIRITAKTEEEAAQVKEAFETHIKKHNYYLKTKPTRFSNQPINLQELETEQAKSSIFFQPEDILPRLELATRVIKSVDFQANKERQHNSVGTVGIFTLTKDGEVILGVDIRGIDLESRTRTVEKVKQTIERNSHRLNLPYTMTQLPGGGEPVRMDERLVQLASQAIETNSIGSYEVTFSPAGHDAMNAAKADIPTVMIFIPSRNGGISHHPEEYSTPQDLENGARALAALAYQLASQKEPLE